MPVQSNDLSRDPVCGMRVDPKQYPLEYQNMHFAFCSPRCRERFLENPELYIPGRGHVPASRTIKHLKTRHRFRLTTAPDSRQQADVNRCLRKLMGIAGVRFKGRDVIIDYDLLETDARQVSNVLDHSGVEVAKSLWHRTRYFVINYLERTRLDALEKSDEGNHRHD